MLFYDCMFAYKKEPNGLIKLKGSSIFDLKYLDEFMGIGILHGVAYDGKDYHIGIYYVNDQLKPLLIVPVKECTISEIMTADHFFMLNKTGYDLKCKIYSLHYFIYKNTMYFLNLDKYKLTSYTYDGQMKKEKETNLKQIFSDGWKKHYGHKIEHTPSHHELTYIYRYSDKLIFGFNTYYVIIVSLDGEYYQFLSGRLKDHFHNIINVGTTIYDLEKRKIICDIDLSSKKICNDLYQTYDPLVKEFYVHKLNYSAK